MVSGATSGGAAGSFAESSLRRDQHFNVMDGLDTYIDDYSQPDPIPEEMLKSLKQANRLLFPEEAAEKDREIEAETARTAVANPGTVPAEAPPERPPSLRTARPAKRS